MASKRQQTDQQLEAIRSEASVLNDSGACCSDSSTELAPELQDDEHRKLMADSINNSRTSSNRFAVNRATGVTGFGAQFTAVTTIAKEQSISSTDDNNDWDTDQQLDDKDDEDDDEDDAVCSALADRVVWHEDDLIVAAELGKALLERNRRLSARLRRARAVAAERSREAAQLAAGLAAARRLDDSRLRACDEVERQCAELERGNDLLRLERRRLMSRIEALEGSEAAAEARADELRRRLAEANANLASASNVAASAASGSALSAISGYARLSRRRSWPGLSAAAVELTTTEALQQLEPRKSRAEHLPVATRRREAAPSAPPPISRQPQHLVPDADYDDDVGRRDRRRLASGEHEPAYRSLFAEARARLRQVLEERPDEGAGSAIE